MLKNLNLRFNPFETSEKVLVCNENSGVPNLVRVSQMKNIQKEGLALFEKKNRDYGDAFARYGTIGVLIRMGDKISRLQSITNNGITLVNDEKMRDTLIDLHNYSAMAIMTLDEGKEMNIFEFHTYADDDFGDCLLTVDDWKPHFFIFSAITVAFGMKIFRHFQKS